MKTLIQRKELDLEKVKAMQAALIAWYEKNHRDLPWRKNKNPYFTWISEVMLQQTRVETVIPYFLKFIQRFPDVQALAESDEEEILKTWEGLGYYSRAIYLHRGAKMIMNQYGGKIPERLIELKKIPGIGSYTAGAILSIAYDQPVPAVDGNVMRVFSRIFEIPDDITQMQTRKKMETLGQSVISQKNPSHFNQGLMDLGALICTPNSPKCDICPLQCLCSAYKSGKQQKLPVKGKKKAIKEIKMEVGIVQAGDKILLTKRPAEGILANLWALPIKERQTDLQEGQSILSEVEENYGIKIMDCQFLFMKKHVFTHQKWLMNVYQLKSSEQVRVDYPEMDWATWNEIEQYPCPAAFLKVIREAQKIL